MNSVIIALILTFTSDTGHIIHGSYAVSSALECANQVNGMREYSSRGIIDTLTEASCVGLYLTPSGGISYQQVGDF